MQTGIPSPMAHPLIRLILKQYRHVMWAWLRCRVLHWSIATDWQQLWLTSHSSLGTAYVGVIKRETSITHMWEKQSFILHVCSFFCLWQASRRLWTCLCGNSLYFFNNAKDSHVSIRLCTLCWLCYWHWRMFVCVTVCGEAGPQWVCVPEGRLQPGQKPGGCQTHPAHEGWRDQTHSNATHICTNTLKLKDNSRFFPSSHIFVSMWLVETTLFSISPVSRESAAAGSL